MVFVNVVDGWIVGYLFQCFDVVGEQQCVVVYVCGGQGCFGVGVVVVDYDDVVGSVEIYGGQIKGKWCNFSGCGVLGQCSVGKWW